MKEKIDTRLGEVFAELRDAAGVSLDYFIEVGISPSSLSRFENGETLLRHDKLVSALQKLHIEEAEFSLMVNDFHYDFFEVVMDKIISAHKVNDKKTLEMFFEDSTKYGHRRIALASSAALHGKLTDVELDELRDKLFAVTTWSYFNLQVLSLTIDQFEESLAISFMKDFWKSDFYYRNTTRYRKLIALTGYKLLDSLIEKSNKVEAKNLLSHLEKFVQEEDICCKICQSFEKAYFEYQFYSTESGVQKMNESLMLFKQFNCDGLYCYYKNLYNEHISRLNFSQERKTS